MRARRNRSRQQCPGAGLRVSRWSPNPREQRRRAWRNRRCNRLPGLERPSKQVVQTIFIASGESELNSAVQHYAVLAVKPGLQLLDLIYIHDGGSVNSHEYLWIELRFKSGNGFP